MTMPATPDDLFTALHRESELVADNIGIPLTADELRQVKERLILAWVVEHLTGHEMLSVGDLLRRYPGDADKIMGKPVEWVDDMDGAPDPAVPICLDNNPIVSTQAALRDLERQLIIGMFETVDYSFKTCELRDENDNVVGTATYR